MHQGFLDHHGEVLEFALECVVALVLFDLLAFQPPLLRISCPYTIYPTFSSLPTDHRSSPSTISSLLRTDIGIYPHTIPSRKRDPNPVIDASSCFTISVLIRFALPPVLRPAGLHFISRMFSSLDSAAAPHPLRSTGFPFRFPFLHRTILSSCSHWFSEVVAYPEPYLELRFPLRSVLYKATRPLVCSLASSTQFSLVSSLPRLALRPICLKPSLIRNGSLRTLRLFVRSSLGYSTRRKPYPVGDYSRTLPTHRRLLERHSRYGSDRRLL